MMTQLGYRYLPNGSLNGLQNNLDCMHKPTSHDFGSETIGKLLIKQILKKGLHELAIIKQLLSRMEGQSLN